MRIKQKKTPKAKRKTATQAAARFLVVEVLRPFAESSLYEDYRDCEDGGFTDEQFDLAVGVLAKLAGLDDEPTQDQISRAMASIDASDEEWDAIPTSVQAKLIRKVR
jgi:hypothetical protein